ncbi:MAG: indolepyruvate ferredoxin oxidoreductase subunit alpha [Chloroflexi bacterium]|nr:indolepyruvate ferredoxin oxidoreductase subunit alpha [Chloroflexota bacterium]
MKKILLGNEAVARGAYEAGVVFASSYPGTPSTEITEALALYPSIFCEWAPNEKVAVEAALGASMAGARALSAMKHVGLNVAADPLFTAAYSGVNGGLVLAVADDPRIHSSQNEQDSRNYFYASKIIALEPADSEECRLFTRNAYSLSEEYDTPVAIRLVTRISHSQSIVQCEKPQVYEQKKYRKDMSKYVMLPVNARTRRSFITKRMTRAQKLADNGPYNKEIIHKDAKIGVITAGVLYQYAREALGTQASYLKIGMISPLPRQMMTDFCQKYQKVYIIEELDPYIETFARSIGITNIIGQKLFPREGEFSAGLIAEKILKNYRPFNYQPEKDLPPRPPVLCPGCSHRPLFYALKRQRLIVTGDIGCYTLGALPPLLAMDSTICMGASVSMGHGVNKVLPNDKKQKVVSVIGDSTFIHSGITGLIDIVYNGGTSTVIILDNSTTGMTGHQTNPACGQDIYGKPAPAVNLEALCRAIGVRRVITVNPFDYKHMYDVIAAEAAASEPSVVIVKAPCKLLHNTTKDPPREVEQTLCQKCRLCMSIGCPSISVQEGQTLIDQVACTGCQACQNLCRFGAIKEKEPL